MSDFLSRVQSGLKAAGFRFSGSGYGTSGSEIWGWPYRTLPGTDYDYRSEAGLLWENSAFAACIRWLGDTWTEPPMVVRQRDDSNRWVPVPGHPAEEWFNDPSPYYDASTLWYGTLLSLKASGDAYWYKLRTRGNRMVGVVYLPHFLVSPRWSRGGTDYIEAYEYRPDAEPVMIDPKDVVHLRLGMDPINQRRGLRVMDAVLREVCTENEIATFHAALLRNGGFPGAIVSPDPAIGAVPELTPTQRADFVANWRERFSKDGAGDVFVQSIPVKVQVPGWKPSEMMMDKIRGLNAAYICSAFGLDPLAIGLPSESKTYSNYEEARRGAYDSLILPLHRTLGRQLDRQLLPEIVGSNPVNQRIGWDYSDVRALQDDRTKIYPVLTQAAGGSWLTVNEARAIADLPPVDGGDDLQPATQPLPPQAVGSTELAPVPAEAEPDTTQKAIKAAPETTEQRRKRERDLMLAMLLLLIADTDHRLAATATAMASASITVGQWRDQTLTELTQAHTSAAYIGRRAAGDTAPMGPQDVAAGDAAAATQAPFLDGFASDIMHGRYAPKPEPPEARQPAPTEPPATPTETPAPTVPTIDIDAVVRRTHLYAQRLRGTAEEQWARSQPEGTRFTWVMGGNEDHCEDCPRLAAGGVYTIDTLPTFPGAGDTECMVNCLCHLETDTGAIGFERGDVVTKRYDPSEPRDEDGKWTSGGGGSAATQADRPAKPENTTGGQLPQEAISVDPNELQYREADQQQNNLDYVRDNYAEGEYPTITTIRNSDGTRTILDGHHRSIVARERGHRISTVDVTRNEYIALTDAGYDDMEIAYAALYVAGETESADSIARQFTGADIDVHGANAQDMLEAIRTGSSTEGLER